MYDFGLVFWSVLLVLVCLLLVACLIIGFVDPCLLGHTDAYFGQAYCDICGEQLRPFCPDCHVYCHPKAAFCDDCGSALSWGVADPEGGEPDA